MSDASFCGKNLARQMCFKSEIVDEIARLHEEGGLDTKKCVLCPNPTRPTNSSCYV